ASASLAAREGKEALAPTLLKLYPRVAEAAVVGEAPATHGGEGAATSAIDPLRLLEEQGSESPWLRYTGIGAAAAGALVTGTGVYFGLQSSRTRGSLDRQSGMSQEEAIATNDRANDQASRANLTLLVGSVLLTAGATALGMDLWGNE
ncbi:MAG: hypothetical protein HYZ27_05800, partial [Deltaproteobacteria bacterium]|nr:hypothetical protein [Deltaproteobacteria bacterium]